VPREDAEAACKLVRDGRQDRDTSLLIILLILSYETAQPVSLNMLLSKSAIVFGLAVLFAAIASPPKLRSATKIAVLLAQHGRPYRAIKAIVRLPALSNVVNSA